jgi:hypothetical protein
MMTIGSYASGVASDNASNSPYNGTAWTEGNNGGVGFGAWGITDGDGEHYVGSTAFGNPAFALSNTFNGAMTTAVRPLLGGALSAGQTFSVDLAFSPFTATGEVGLDIRTGNTTQLELLATTSGDWMLNTGGSNFDAGSAATANTRYHFTFTYNGGNSYSYTLTGGPGGSSLTASTNLSGIDNVSFFNFNQGPEANFAFNNLSVSNAVPEPGTILMFTGGAALLGAIMFLRRRRT